MPEVLHHHVTEDTWNKEHFVLFIYNGKKCESNGLHNWRKSIDLAAKSSEEIKITNNR